MRLDVTTTTDEGGGLRHVFNLDETDLSELNMEMDIPTDEVPAHRLDTLVIRHTPDDAERMTCHCYDETGEVIWQHAFETRDMTFDPISLLGRGESDRLLGTSPTDDYVGPGDVDGCADVPDTVCTMFNALGMAIVPQGEWWLNG